MAMSVVMPGLMKSYNDGQARLNASMSAMYEPSRHDGGQGRRMADEQRHEALAPNTYKSNFGDD